jgi:SAM-dependent methyltransferase
MNSYAGLHARHYDRIYAGKPYEHEAAFVAGLLGGGDGALLDVACGTGRHARAFAGLGWDVTGVDLNPLLLEHARASMPEGRFVEGDMRALESLGLEPGSFAAVTCLFDSTGYPLTNDGVLAALRGMRALLRRGGTLVAEFLHTPAMLRGASPLGLRRWPLDDDGGGELLRVSQTRLDEPRSLMQVDYELIELRGDGGWERHAERQENRFFGVEEMRALVAAAGLEAERFVPAYEDGAVTGETFHVMVVAR